ncbi:hypothetical protein I302_104235 [Kwoniella bestiolae CBS 10118]|uniref:Uncharacterized protein n=1 Tax=Kwoniella bestiolae CBS 10118 TaxID=1296100 RepID=A0A1B9GAP1_9TREE|nr:hypothetical protein I302_02944 [Kwoniella bestiolae CBS 10118]OCF28093.1 hypothetical protein I302_02944 [Kwoniella bestiolae CBS 10118]
MKLSLALTTLLLATKSVQAGCKDPHYLGGVLGWYCVDEVTHIEFEYLDMDGRFTEMAKDHQEEEVMAAVYKAYHAYLDPTAQGDAGAEGDDK